MSKRAVFLDRDGVLTEPIELGGHERPAWSLDELRIIPGVAGALNGLRAAGFLLVAITNQPDIARGQVSAAEVGRINGAMADQLSLDAVYVCPHSGASCTCRKPLPGMIHQAANDLHIDLSRSWLVGDRWVDIAAGDAAGVRSVLVDRPGSWAATSAGSPPPSLRPEAVVDTMVAAAGLILAADEAP